MNGKPGQPLGVPFVSQPGLKRSVDTLKGSYYANPVLDKPDVSPILREAYPEYYGANICKRSSSSDKGLV